MRLENTTEPGSQVRTGETVAVVFELLDRNVIRFVEQRLRLSQLGLSTKKGLLFYGPPGTGKTHTVHYLAGALPGHTTLLISAEQVGLLDQYMTLARLLQPSMVVIEDVDLIARDRTEMKSACEEVLLNKLLNEMDGLKQDADVLFILTTNRPETLEKVSASFIKELLRRAMQFHLEHDDSGQLAMDDIDNALEELLFTGGSLNRKLLGGEVTDEV